MAWRRFNPSDPRYAIPGLEISTPALLERCGGFNPEYFVRRYGPIFNLAESAPVGVLVQTYLSSVAQRFLNPHAHFNEARYRGLNRDVDELVSSGEFKSGYHHWLLIGCHENRPGCSDEQGHSGQELGDYLAARQGTP